MSEDLTIRDFWTHCIMCKADDENDNGKCEYKQSTEHNAKLFDQVVKREMKKHKKNFKKRVDKN